MDNGNVFRLIDAQVQSYRSEINQCSDLLEKLKIKAQACKNDKMLHTKYMAEILLTNNRVAMYQAGIDALKELEAKIK